MNCASLATWADKSAEASKETGTETTSSWQHARLGAAGSSVFV